MVDEVDGRRLRARLTAVDAAQTPPFLTDRRVVVVRDLGRFERRRAGRRSSAYLADPLPTTDLVLVWDERRAAASPNGAVPKKLIEAVEGGRRRGHRHRGRRAASAQDVGRRRSSAQPAPSSSTRARESSSDRLGEDVDRLVGVIDGARGDVRRRRAARADDVEPYLGEAGSVPPWELTDAIDEGDDRRLASIACTG